MAHVYVERVVRFGVGLLAAAILLAVVVRAVPGGGPAGMGTDVSWVMRRPVAEVVSEQLSFTWRTVGLGVGVGLPLALLLGIPAGLRPHSALDRGLQGPVVALMGIPAFALMPSFIAYAAFPSGGDVSVQGAVRAGLVVAWAAWMARAVRDGVVGARAGDWTGDRPSVAPTGDRALRTVAAVAGRILQQAGNLAVLLMVAEQVGALPGVLRLTLTALYTRDLPVVMGALWAVVPAVLVAHLIGDLLVTYGEGAGRPSAPVCRVWLVVGGAMAAVLLVTALLPASGADAIDVTSRLLPPGTPGHPLGTDQVGRDLLKLTAFGARTSLMLTGVALVVAAIGGGVLGSIAGAIGRWGGALSPRVAVPGLWAPMFVAVSLIPLNPPSVLRTALAMGVASIPAMATGFRWLVRKQMAGERRAALVGFLGVLTLVVAQILLTEFILGFFGLATMPPVQGLGGVVGGIAQFLRQGPWVLYLAIPAALGSAGFFLVGHALMDAAGTRLEGGPGAQEQGAQAAS